MDGVKSFLIILPANYLAGKSSCQQIILPFSK